jgi:PKD repeat protein
LVTHHDAIADLLTLKRTKGVWYNRRVKSLTVLLALIAVLIASSGCSFIFSSEEPTPTPVPTGPPRADFVASPTQVKGKGWVQFTSTSAGNIKHWYWDFGNGRTNTGPETRSFYSEDGYYTVTLRVESWDGETDRIAKEDYIYVYGCG